MTDNGKGNDGVRGKAGKNAIVFRMRYDEDVTDALDTIRPDDALW